MRSITLTQRADAERTIDICRLPLPSLHGSVERPGEVSLDVTCLTLKDANLYKSYLFVPMYPNIKQTD